MALRRGWRRAAAAVAAVDAVLMANYTPTPWACVAIGIEDSRRAAAAHVADRWARAASQPSTGNVHYAVAAAAIFTVPAAP
uniref:Secreted protein n=1 Tax=Oryza meridionalis TaxID=40149 RepID=A0A0E0DE29_9ORYZ